MFFLSVSAMTQADYFHKNTSYLSQDCIAACMGVIYYLIWRVTIRYDSLYYQQVTLKLHVYVVAHPNLMQCIRI